MQNRREQLLQMLEEQPGDTFIIYALGMEALAHNDYTEALQRFSEVIKIDPTHHPSFYRLAVIYQFIDLIDVARTFAEKGKQLAIQQNNRKAAGEFQTLLDELD